MTTGRFREREQLQIPQTSTYPFINDLLESTRSFGDFKEKVKNHAWDLLEENPEALNFYQGNHPEPGAMTRLRWCDLAAIRLLDYIRYQGITLTDPNTDREIKSDPLRLLWESFTESKPVHPDFMNDFYHLFKQLNNKAGIAAPDKERLKIWMERHPSGLDPEIIRMRKRNRDRILTIFIRKMENRVIRDGRYSFPEGTSYIEKLRIARKWWKEKTFHLRFAVRNPDDLNDLLGNTLSKETMTILKEAERKKIPFFINPYYLSLLNIDEPKHLRGTDRAIRSYVLYSKDLVEAFGSIHAWEREDDIQPGKPNAAGWILPPYPNIHRRYPEVSILIPDSMGRACGGLCSSCQRMYDFQSGHLNFNLDKLAPTKRWPERLEELLRYFRNDRQLRDILITGGDALMSSNRTLKQILDAVYEMAHLKREDNRHRKPGKKYAEMVRVRLGTRLPVYLPQRIDDELIQILKEFRRKASRLGFRQFFIQTHFETAMEITPEAADAIGKLQESGWTVINQMVFTAAASVRGHASKLRKVLNDLGVLSYYTFSVKGYLENRDPFATNARLVQEQVEEKVAGEIPPRFVSVIRNVCENSEDITKMLQQIRDKAGLPFLATDRSVLNIPGVGKSLTFKTIGLTPDGRRILLFDHDHTRNHSPIIEQMGKVTIVESKSVSAYLRQMKKSGEDPEDYKTLFSYSAGITEPRFPLFDYPEYPFQTTTELNHIHIEKMVPSHRE